MGKKHDKNCKAGEDCSKEDHLCRIVKRNDFDQLRELIRDARFFCGKCGRSAHEADNLCRPAAI